MRKIDEPLDVTDSAQRRDEIVRGDRSAARRLMIEHDAPVVLVVRGDGSTVRYAEAGR